MTVIFSWYFINDDHFYKLNWKLPEYTLWSIVLFTSPGFVTINNLLSELFAILVSSFLSSKDIGYIL